MRITPLEIRQKSFEKKMRGYDKDAVDAFIISLSHEWERSLDDSKHLTQQLAAAQHDVKKLREVEESLFKTLKTAEDTGSHLIDQASKNAELTIKEAQMNAEAMLAEARSQVRDMLDQADAHVKEVLGGLDDEARRVEGDLRMAENHRDVVLRELSMLANDTLARVTKFTTERVDITVPKKEILKPTAPIMAPVIIEEEVPKEELRKEEKKEEITEEIKPTYELPKPQEKPVTEVTNEVSFEINTSFEETKQDPIVEEEENNSIQKNPQESPKQTGSFFDHLD